MRGSSTLIVDDGKRVNVEIKCHLICDRCHVTFPKDLQPSLSFPMIERMAITEGWRVKGDDVYYCWRHDPKKDDV